MPDLKDKELEAVLEGKSLKEAKAEASQEESRLGTKRFCHAWMRAGEYTTNWDEFVKEFRRHSGFPYYGEHLIIARIEKYTAQMATVRGVHPPKYPKKRTPVAVMFFANTSAEKEYVEADDRKASAK